MFASDLQAIRDRRDQAMTAALPDALWVDICALLAYVQELETAKERALFDLDAAKAEARQDAADIIGDVSSVLEDTRARVLEMIAGDAMGRRILQTQEETDD